MLVKRVTLIILKPVRLSIFKASPANCQPRTLLFIFFVEMTTVSFDNVFNRLW